MTIIRIDSPLIAPIVKNTLITTLAFICCAAGAVAEAQLSEDELNLQQSEEFVSSLEAVGFDANCFTKEDTLVGLKVIADFLKRDDLTFKILHETLFAQAMLVLYTAEKPADLQVLLDTKQDVLERYPQYAEKFQELNFSADVDLEELFEQTASLRVEFQAMQEKAMKKQER